MSDFPPLLLLLLLKPAERKLKPDPIQAAPAKAGLSSLSLSLPPLLFIPLLLFLPFASAVSRSESARSPPTLPPPPALLLLLLQPGQCGARGSGHPAAGQPRHRPAGTRQGRQSPRRAFCAAAPRTRWSRSLSLVPPQPAIPGGDTPRGAFRPLPPSPAGSPSLRRGQPGPGVLRSRPRSGLSPPCPLPDTGLPHRDACRGAPAKPETQSSSHPQSREGVGRQGNPAEPAAPAGDVQPRRLCCTLPHLPFLTPQCQHQPKTLSSYPTSPFPRPEHTPDWKTPSATKYTHTIQDITSLQQQNRVFQKQKVYRGTEYKISRTIQLLTFPCKSSTTKQRISL